MHRLARELIVFLIGYCVAYAMVHLIFDVANSLGFHIGEALRTGLEIGIAMTGAQAAIVFIPRWRARERALRAKGLCVHCGYDVRTTPDRCPECGRVPYNIEKSQW